MTTRPFQQVDVFTAVPFKGNPVAVILDGNGLATAEMQAVVAGFMSSDFVAESAQ